MAIGTSMAILGAAAIGGVASLAGGAMQANAANQAAQVQSQAADKSLAVQQQQFDQSMGFQQKQADQSRADALPWMEAGKKALVAYQGELGLSDEAKNGTFQSGFKETPGYQFAVNEGEKGAVNNLAALGMKNSGAALKALTRFRTGLADQTYNNYLDRLSAASQGGQATVANQNALGQNAANSMSSLGQNFANSAGQTLQDKGAATASGYVGGANAWSNALSNISNQAGWALGMGSKNFGNGFNFGNA